ncbi:MAG: hypothetical protein KBG47_10705 [Bacteroidia bacterium]|jgi:hypothetical protein|nr:hypothetical protein [Sphingobacteriaceae bacterium]MBK7310672.1 hypothetical protein [Sphingobacteriaceae bacterium]MBK7817767.1 hypothetical protein [Sphingobacteriaceae bacterium]MBP9069969.1 hypothetical protein [Bacteroidia bacterium]
MKNRRNGVTSGLTLLGLLMLSNSSFASLSDKFTQYVGDASNLASLYIIAGVIAVGVIGKLIQNHMMREEARSTSNVKMSSLNNHNHQRHHRPRAVVKKTS